MILRLVVRWLPGLCLSEVALLLLAAGIGQLTPESTLAFNSRVSLVEPYNLYLLAVPHHLKRQLTHNQDIEGRTDWSPDGQSLVYTTFNGDDYDIYGLNVINGERTILVENPAFDTGGAWSPDGRLLVFSSNRDSASDLYTLELTTGSIVRLDNHPGRDVYPQWSPDGNRIAYISNRDRDFASTDMTIQVLDLATRNIQPQRSSLVSRAAIWSPDGCSLIFTSAQAGISGDKTDIFRLDLDTQTTVNLTRNPHTDMHPAWSPDGHWLAFTSDRDGNYDLYLLDLLPAGQPGDVQRLTSNAAFDGFPTWRP